MPAPPNEQEKRIADSLNRLVTRARDQGFTVQQMEAFAGALEDTPFAAFDAAAEREALERSRFDAMDARRLVEELVGQFASQFPNLDVRIAGDFIETNLLRNVTSVGSFPSFDIAEIRALTDPLEQVAAAVISNAEPLIFLSPTHPTDELRMGAVLRGLETTGQINREELNAALVGEPSAQPLLQAVQRNLPLIRQQVTLAPSRAFDVAVRRAFRREDAPQVFAPLIEDIRGRRPDLLVRTRPDIALERALQALLDAAHGDEAAEAAVRDFIDRQKEQLTLIRELAEEEGVDEEAIEQRLQSAIVGAQRRALREIEGDILQRRQVTTQGDLDAARRQLLFDLNVPEQSLSESGIAQIDRALRLFGNLPELRNLFGPLMSRFQAERTAEEFAQRGGVREAPDGDGLLQLPTLEQLQQLQSLGLALSPTGELQPLTQPFPTFVPPGLTDGRRTPVTAFFQPSAEATPGEALSLLIRGLSQPLTPERQLQSIRQQLDVAGGPLAIPGLPSFGGLVRRDIPIDFEAGLREAAGPDLDFLGFLGQRLPQLRERFGRARAEESRRLFGLETQGLSAGASQQMLEDFTFPRFLGGELPGLREAFAATPEQRRPLLRGGRTTFRRSI